MSSQRKVLAGAAAWVLCACSATEPPRAALAPIAPLAVTAGTPPLAPVLRERLAWFPRTSKVVGCLPPLELSSAVAPCEEHVRGQLTLCAEGQSLVGGENGSSVSFGDIDGAGLYACLRAATQRRGVLHEAQGDRLVLTDGDVFIVRDGVFAHPSVSARATFGTAGPSVLDDPAIVQLITTTDTSRGWMVGRGEALGPDWPGTAQAIRLEFDLGARATGVMRLDTADAAAARAFAARLTAEGLGGTTGAALRQQDLTLDVSAVGNQVHLHFSMANPLAGMTP